MSLLSGEPLSKRSQKEKDKKMEGPVRHYTPKSLSYFSSQTSVRTETRADLPGQVEQQVRGKLKGRGKLQSHLVYLKAAWSPNEQLLSCSFFWDTYMPEPFSCRHKAIDLNAVL